MDRLQFLFKIESIAPNYEEQPENRVGDLKQWSPPSIPRAVTTISSTQWFRWKASGITCVGSNAHNTVHDICSVFYNSECSQFIGVPFDCRVHSVEEAEREHGLGWRRLMFRHGTTEFGGIPRSLSTIRLQEESHVLASRTTPYWMPQLLPESFKRNEGDPLRNGMERDTCLAGDLSLMMALTAFSAPPDRMLQTIKTSFKPPYWLNHQFGEGSRCFPPTSDIR